MLTKRERAEALALVTGPKGGLLRGRRRPTAAEFCEGLCHWPTTLRASALFWMVLAGRVQ